MWLLPLAGLTASIVHFSDCLVVWVNTLSGCITGSHWFVFSPTIMQPTNWLVMALARGIWDLFTLVEALVYAH
jgi:hypothetical protein